METKKIETKYPVRFGNYLVLDHLIDGGMAKICRARYLGEEADKIVAIKMVRPQFSSDPEFKKMFVDEIKVSFGLSHPNISQTYDYGMTNKQLFVSMEYIDGKNLKQYLDRLVSIKSLFPVEVCIYITSKICEGLFYAHSYEDKLSGTKLNMVHRDISPHNIMLSYDGAVKIIDFGIAKAATNSETTQSGSIKGKVSYIAPEYLEGKEIDARYDQFAVGLTIWELLTGRKVFQAENELATLKKIMDCQIPAPSTLNNQVPPELDQIVLKACSKDPMHRYDNMDAFNRDLVKLLFLKFPNFNPSDLGIFAHQLFKEEIAKDREKFLEFGKIDTTPYLQELKKEQSSAATTLEKKLESTAMKRIELDFGFDNITFKNNKNVDEAFELDYERKNGGTKFAHKLEHNFQNALLKHVEVIRKNEKSKAKNFVDRTNIVSKYQYINQVEEVDESKSDSFIKKAFKMMFASTLLLATVYGVYLYAVDETSSGLFNSILNEVSKNVKDNKTIKGVVEGKIFQDTKSLTDRINQKIEEKKKEKTRDIATNSIDTTPKENTDEVNEEAPIVEEGQKKVEEAPAQ